MARKDPHSYADGAQGRTRHVAWTATLDFARRTLECTATLKLTGVAGGPLHLDTRDLEIERVESGAGEALPFTLGEPDKILGTRLEVTVPAGLEALRITYRVGPNASALQWLAPEQTAGGEHPFLFSQCQAIHARSLIPLQDSPAFRITYDARMTVPKALRVLMAARGDGRTEHTDGTGLATELFTMPQPIPPYLLAFCVGDLASRALGPRSRVWAEPSVVDAAAWEFEGVEAMIAGAERLFGPYDWERFDVLVMPPSFPYGGMENPRLTFLTPTLLAGDRSQVNVLAHELAHSWTGNLVTNASAEHFWLNEGWTVYAERRLLEALEGREYSELHAALGRSALGDALRQFAERPALTRLRTELWGVDPDEVFSVVPYEKGYLFLRACEEAVGRERFDRFVRDYVSTHRFGALTTDEFLEFLRAKLPEAVAKVNVTSWIDAPGLPESAPVAMSQRLEAVRRQQDRVPDESVSAQWGATELQLYLDSLTRPASGELLDALERRWALSESKNRELLVSWLELCLESGRDVLAQTEAVLGEVGRLKFVKPLYAAMAKRADGKARARETFERVRARYHPITVQVVEGVLKRYGA